MPEPRRPTHPGQILAEEFLSPRGLSQTGLAKALHIPIQRINELVKGKRGITPETAWLLAGAFATTPEFWMNLQVNFDLARTKPKKLGSPLRGGGSDHANR